MVSIIYVLIPPDSDISRIRECLKRFRNLDWEGSNFSMSSFSILNPYTFVDLRVWVYKEFDRNVIGSPKNGILLTAEMASNDSGSTLLSVVNRNKEMIMKSIATAFYGYMLIKPSTESVFPDDWVDLTNGMPFN